MVFKVKVVEFVGFVGCFIYIDLKDVGYLKGLIVLLGCWMLVDGV